MLPPIRITQDAVLLKSGLRVPDKPQLNRAGGGMGIWTVWREVLASQVMSRHISPLIRGRRAQSGTTLQKTASSASWPRWEVLFEW